LNFGNFVVVESKGLMLLISKPIIRHAFELCYISVKKKKSIFWNLQYQKSLGIRINSIIKVISVLFNCLALCPTFPKYL
jgi:hypothetical protein